MRPERIAHLTTAHSRFDVRIFHKECVSLAKHWETHLIVADGKGDGTALGVAIHDAGRSSGRFMRMALAPWRVLLRAWGLKADLYHFHDPELLPVGLLLRLRGASVVYDAHEDVPRQILSKSWVPRSSRRMISRAVEWLEKAVARRLSAVVAATPLITKRFLAEGTRRVINVNNFPIIEEFSHYGSAHLSQNRGERTICYVGGISSIRGIRQIISALPEARATLLLAGWFEDPEFEAELRKMPEWKHVDYFGVVDREGVRSIMGRARIGLVLLHPVPNYLDSLPVKMFEYMAAGIAVLASNFPLWHQIVELEGVGKCVDPRDTSAISRTLLSLLNDPAEMDRMGRQGAEIVQQRYNWHNEEARLLKLYQDLLSTR